jgi:hypothetical protein
MLVSLRRLTPAAVKHCDRRADLGGSCSQWIVERANECLQRLRRMVARPQSKRAKVARQRPTYGLPPRRSLLCPRTWSSAAARH